jgi:putative aldouronate transport system permease protein
MQETTFCVLHAVSSFPTLTGRESLQKKYKRREYNIMQKMTTVSVPAKKSGFFQKLSKDFKQYKSLYLILLPVLIYFIIFCYWPMNGVIIAFKKYKPRLGVMDSKWVGLENFQQYFGSAFFKRTVSNTILLNLYNLIFGFSVPILFAILLNEVQNKAYKKVIQSITYLPHFVTTVIVASMIIQFTNSEGFITYLVNNLTGHSGSLISDASMFRRIFVISGIWQSFGWNSIIYMAALTGINPDLYEASYIDGANKFRQIWHITLPGIMPTIVIMLILACGSIMSLGWEKAFLLQSPLTYETSDIISTFVYRKGFQEQDYSYSTAVDLFNSVINLLLLTLANSFSKRFGESSLW